eukprot:TRINITY_DN67818_c0_g1_i1.p1 TRINITY_DN67818_c0_g1~~TRINITY_DN67818_c0_g1_i1.p1  ORF type:complete len:115 (+),score=3.69 TRINITY_DN67818_c0_g1_i1:198-542(+)
MLFRLSYLECDIKFSCCVFMEMQACVFVKPRQISNSCMHCDKCVVSEICCRIQMRVSRVAFNAASSANQADVNHASVITFAPLSTQTHLSDVYMSTSLDAQSLVCSLKRINCNL